MKLGAALPAVLSLTTAASTAHAEPRGFGGFDWGKAVVDLDAFARGSSDQPVAAPKKQTIRPGTSEDPSPQNMGNAWFGVAPRMTLVARDWASSTRLAGDRLSLLDAVRLSQSTRMVVGRARLSATRFTPFVQVGVGQWRVDRTVLPLTPRIIEVATQFGGGFELRITRAWQLAAEATGTTLFRDGTGESVPQTMLWSTFIASRLSF